MARVLLGCLLACAALLGFTSSAWAGVGFLVVPNLASPLTVGQTGVPATLTIQNGSNGAEAALNVTVTQITLVPACGTQAVSGGDCPVGSFDPGVLLVSPTGTGAAGTACAGTTFTTSVIDAAQGKYLFTPSTSVVLGPTGSPTSTCIIDFTVSVVKVPTKDADLTTPGFQTTQIGFAFGIASDNHTGGGFGTNGVTILAATVPIATQVTPATITLGGAFHDTAELTPPAGAAVPTGTVTFNVYGPGDPTCAATPVFTSTNALNAAGTTAVSNNFTPSTAGTYRVIATYSGDANYNPVSSSCADPAEAVVVNKAPLPIATVVSPTPIVLGASFHDTATLGPAPAGAAAPTGTVTFKVYGPADPTCAATPVFSSTNAVNLAGTSAVSGMFTPATTGTYRVVATYSGDANYAGSASSCGEATENAVVTKAPLPIATAVSPTPIVLGSAFHDTATLGPAPAGAAAPTGTVTFNVYAPADTTCAAAPVFTSTTAVNLAGTSAVSGMFTPSTTGTYRVIATYSGDANYLGSSSLCSDPAEAEVVNKAPLAIATAVAPTPIVLGASFHDTATLGPAPAGAAAPTGTVTFNVYGPADPTCAAAPVFTSTNALNAAGTSAVSGMFTPATAGTYRVVATYSGDGNYSGSASSCADPAEAEVVTKAPLAIVTVASLAAGGKFSDVATLGPVPAGGAAPTGTVTFSVYGPADATCSGAVLFTSTNALNAAGTSATSSTFTAAGPGTYRFVAVYSGDANYGSVSSLCNAASEVVSIPMPVIAVTKAVVPLSEVEPGGSFTFTVQVSNPSGVDPITITSLVDNVYGNLVTRAGSTCGMLIGVTLAPGMSSLPCSFPGPFMGKAGDTQTDTVTVNGVDVNGFTATATAQATVTLTAAPPLIAVTKAAAPLSEVEPGGTFTFTVQVHNPSTLEPVTITKLVDNVYGDLTAITGSTCGSLIGVVLQPGGTSPSCSFPGVFHGKAGDAQTDTVTVTGVNNGVTVTAMAMAMVTLTPAPPLIAVTKAAAPPSEVEPGGSFTFTVVVHNPSTLEPVTITKLVDNLYGDLTAIQGSTCGSLIGVVLPPGGTSPSCSFPGTFTGVAGASQTDTVTVTGVNNGTTVTATAMATVTLTPLGAPVIAVTKAAAPLSMAAPGGDFTFTVSVSNPSTTTPVKITQLVDNVYGDLTLARNSTCAPLIGRTLAPGASTAPCTFTGSFTGAAGATQTDTVTVTGTNNGITVTATAHAMVSLTPPPAGPQIAVTKAASPSSRVAPGGTFTFTATVSNPSSSVPVTITQLIDNIYGNLATRPGSTCGALIGVTLAPGATSSPCTFTGPFNGSSGASQTDVITVTGTHSGTTVTATAQATVTLTKPPAGVILPIALHAPGACVATPFKVYVTGTNVRAATFYIDGKRYASVSKRDAQGRLSITINPARLRRGATHRLKVVTQPVLHSGQPVRTVSRTFAVCAPPIVPRFTG